MCKTIDMTPSWGEVGLIAKRLAYSSEFKAMEALWPEVARAFASAEALNAVLPSLTSEQLDKVFQVMQAELHKQGH